MNFNIGILIAGSLWWDGDKIHRQRWREQSLEIDQAVSVNIPIRYGRLSSSRRNTYTMVYAPETPLGRGKAVPCRNRVDTFDELIVQAEALWAAEQKDDSKPPLSISEKWGCVALLPNPQSDIPSEFLAQWVDRVSRERDSDGEPTYRPSRYRMFGESAINSDGLLKIEWPSSSSNKMPLKEFDLLLATATRPWTRPNTLVTPETIASAWNNNGYVSYFNENRRHDITTFQDEEIAALLKTVAQS